MLKVIVIFSSQGIEFFKSLFLILSKIFSTNEKEKNFDTNISWKRLVSLLYLFETFDAMMYVGLTTTLNLGNSSVIPGVSQSRYNLVFSIP